MEAKQVDEDQDSDEEFEDRLQRHRRIMGPEIVHSQVRETSRKGWITPLPSDLETVPFCAFVSDDYRSFPVIR